MKIFNLIFMFISCLVFSQNTYVDPTVTTAMITSSNNLKSKQNQTISNTSKLKDAQMFVSAQMVIINDLQSKLLKGLREVSGTLQNGIQVKEILADVERCKNYSSDILTLAKKHPQYAVFGVKSSEKVYEQAVRTATDVFDILASGDLNLSTAGDRYKLLFSISENIKNLKLWLINVKMRLESANRLGFWNTINPFASYINTDTDIVKEIMRKYEGNY